MSENTMMVLRETRDLAVANLNEHTSLGNNMLEAISLVHATLDSAGIDGEKSVGIVERVRRLLSKSESDREKLVVTDELHNTALTTIESKVVEIEELKDQLAISKHKHLEKAFQAHETVESANKRISEELERSRSAYAKTVALEEEIESIKYDRDRLREEIASMKAEKAGRANETIPTVNELYDIINNQSNWITNRKFVSDKSIANHLAPKKAEHHLEWTPPSPAEYKVGWTDTPNKFYYDPVTHYHYN